MAIRRLVQTPRISASSYSNTAPLIWSFLYGSKHGRVELILDNAPARSVELLSQRRVDAALVPVIAYHAIEDARLVPGICIGAKERVRSVCLVTRGKDLDTVRSVALDTSSKTSVVLTKILFREFLGFEPEWRDAAPDIEAMLESSDCALLIGDPALAIADFSNAECGLRIAEEEIADRGLRIADSSSLMASGLLPNAQEDSVLNRPDGDPKSAIRNPRSAIKNPRSAIRKFDLAELWKQYTGLGFIFAMWMTHAETPPVDFGAARDEGLKRIEEIVSNYLPDIKISEEDFRTYISQNISYTVDEDLQQGMELYFELAKKHGVCENVRELRYTS